LKLLIQPDDGIAPVVRAIGKAKKSVEIVIFRFDLVEIEHALEEAVKRGVTVRALIAFTNRGGEKNLRKLELRLLARGVIVARTADDLVRYHGKMLLIDRQELLLLAFNFTHLDTEHSRSFAIVTRDKELVREAGNLFDADMKRRKYKEGSERFLVSPVNSRERLSEFISGAKKELLIYDVKIADRDIVRLIQERARAGVDVRVIGKVSKGGNQIAVRKLNRMRLHARSIIRDRKIAFLGSQSLRELELDARREIGIIFKDAKVIPAMIKVFEDDWNNGAVTEDFDENRPPVVRVAKKVAKTVTKSMGPVAPVVEQIVKEQLGPNGNVDIDHQEVEEAVKDAVKQAIKEAVREVVEDAVEQPAESQA
jgi:cardiolipin synthase